MTTLNDLYYANNLQMNTQKTQLIYFRSIKTRMSIRHETFTIEAQDSVKYLGVVVDKGLDKGLDWTGLHFTYSQR